MTAALVREYLDIAVRGDHRAATELALRTLSRSTVDAVLADLVGAAQRETGLRWHRNAYTVADEHVVTITSIAVVDAVVAAARATSWDAVGGSVIVACAEGDWHAMPARLFAERLRLLGWDVTFLGASIPADHVAEYLDRRRPDALCISSSLPLTYAGVAALAEVARAAGVATVAGGLAIGDHPARAVALGVDVGAASPAEADLALRRLGAEAPVSSHRSPPASAWELDAHAAELADAAMAGLGAAYPALRRLDARQLRRAHEDLAFTIRYAAAAIAVDDRRVWDEFVAWQTSLLGVRGVPERAFHAGAEALAAHVSGRWPEAAALLASAADGPPARGATTIAAPEPEQVSTG